jgi:hypothetical protein
MTKGNGHQDPRVTSLDEARKKAAEKAKAAPRPAGERGPRTTRDWLIGGAVIAMAVAYLVHLVMTAAHTVGGGN